MEKVIVLGEENLSLKNFIDVARFGCKVSVADFALDKLKKSRSVVDDLLKKNRPMYGINTGFGRFADVAISDAEIGKLQVNLIRADAVGIGAPFDTEIVRGMLLLRANSIIQGLSGASLEVPLTMVEMLNKGVHPVIPEKGSVGSSGDLCPLAHMVLPMIGEGEAEYKGQIMSGKESMERAGIPLVTLKAKDGLALINGTPAMTSVAALALHDSLILQISADIISALTFESLRGVIDAFDSRIHKARNQSGQIDVAENLTKLLVNSRMITHQAEERVQDSYTLRCIPQVHGASRMAIDYAREVVESELNAVTDNPLVFPDTGDVFSGGNFHGQPIAIAMDTLGIAVSEFGNISERRIAKLVDPALNHGLPAFLVNEGGVNTGFMVPQYAAAALVSENKVLAHPASVDSIPTSAGQEDHVSFGTTSARKARQIIDHVQSILGIELMCAAQALDLQEIKSLSEGTSAAYQLLRSKVDFMENDRVFYKDQELAKNLISDGMLLNEVEKIVKDLK